MRTVQVSYWNNGVWLDDINVPDNLEYHLDNYIRATIYRRYKIKRADFQITKWYN